MLIKELSIHEFSSYAKKHDLSNYAQSINYAILMTEYGYEYEVIGFEENNQLIGASLILIKSINGLKYGYAPKGFLIDYSNELLLKNVTNLVKEYYKDKNFIFIKINPEITVGEINNKTYEPIYNNNIYLKNYLKNAGFSKLKDNLYFESMFPRFNPIIDYNSYNVDNFGKNTKNKIKKGIRKGLEFSDANPSDISYLNNFINKNNFFLKDFYNVFEKTNDIDFFVVTINPENYLKNSRYIYNEQLDINQKLNELMITKSTTKNINTKMSSDKKLLTYKNDMLEATKMLENNNKVIIAAALVVKNNDYVKIIASGYDKNYKRFVPNYFLYHNVIKHYSFSHKYIDLNGISGDFTNESPFKGLNDFKLGFKPNILEYVGEYDLIINENAYYHLIKTGKLTKEFSSKY